MLTVRPLSRKLSEYNEILSTYQTSFPKNEKLPFWLLSMLAKRKKIDFFVFYDKAVFCGFTYLIHQERTTFVLYLAVNLSIRSQGYGSQILEWIAEEYSHNAIVLNIETVSDTKCNNYEERLKRQQFYFKNGYHDTHYKTVELGVSYDVLSTQQSFRPDALRKIYHYLSFGLYPLKIMK